VEVGGGIWGVWMWLGTAEFHNWRSCTRTISTWKRRSASRCRSWGTAVW